MKAASAGSPIPSGERVAMWCVLALVVALLTLAALMERAVLRDAPTDARSTSLARISSTGSTGSLLAAATQTTGAAGAGHGAGH